MVNVCSQVLQQHRCPPSRAGFGLRPLVGYWSSLYLLRSSRIILCVRLRVSPRALHHHRVCQ
eukprot:10807346-Prorocentrum_lima.AAC.1